MLAADEKELAYQCVCYWRFKRSFRFARQMQNYTPFLRANEACSILLLTHFQDANPGT